jgi:hypothetical protein
MTRSLICLFFLTAFALAQPPAGKGKAAPVQAGPVLTDELTAYLLPDDLKLKNRDLQLEWAEREAANQTMLVTIEKNKARQAAITDELRTIDGQFAASKAIDLKVWEMDSKELKFVKKKASIK